MTPLLVASVLASPQAAGQGWLPGRPNHYAFPAPEGNYDVTIHYDNADAASAATVKAESRRVMLMAGQSFEGAARKFAVNVRQPAIKDGGSVRLRTPEDAQSATWDDQLTLEFLPNAESVETVEVVPTQEAVTVYLAGDSTVTDQSKEPWAGWGQMLPAFFEPGVAVANHAESGRALYSFRAERRLEKILSTIQPGDYLFIQFGHNDQKSRAEGAGPFTTYKKDLEDYVASARVKRANPVIVTPMERRRWSDGQPRETLAEYAEAGRQVGAEMKVPVIDLHAKSLEFYAALGEEGSKQAFVHYPAGSFPGQSKPLSDDTHHSSYGAFVLAQLLADGVKTAVPELARRIRPGLPPVDPSEPIPYDEFLVPDSLDAFGDEKPEGQ